MKIAVAGATGRLGAHLVELLEASGYEVAPIARSQGVDVITGKGLEKALADANTVVDATTSPTPDAATEFFLTATGNIQKASERVGVRRVVLVSIIGCDRFTGAGAFGGYYVAKAAQERAYRDGPISARILRAAQFHEFVGELLHWGTQGELAQVPAMQTQLVAARSVAEALAELATAPDAAGQDGEIPEIAGPRPERLVEMARLLASRRGGPARVEEAAAAADADGALIAGEGLLPGPKAKLAGPTFAAWLDSQDMGRMAA